MKNPFMSAWLSAANKVTGAARGQMAAEVAKAQKKALAGWTRALTGKAPAKPRKKR